ncbi:MAG: hypothetical protein LBL90_06810 [Prevotellaceae bacterium]|jgi:Spy/CpxP family protein refolding chaperone|nr:hypothetical protein [Prevotellaceae bacterium]
MKTKLQLLFIACLMAFSLNVMAQAEQSVEVLAKSITDKMTKALSLTQDQIDKLQTINTNYVKKTLDLKKQFASNKTELEKQLKENNADREVKARKVFTEKQYSTFLQRKAEFEIKR